MIPLRTNAFQIVVSQVLTSLAERTIIRGMNTFEAFADGQSPRTFATKAEAIAWVDQFEDGEVRDWTTDAQVYVKWPIPVWVR